MSSKIIAIVGGIGSGKSVVSKILSTMGFSVYDCDAEAKNLMNESLEIREQLTKLLGAEAYNGQGCLSKEYVAHKIFNDHSILEAVNEIVHPVVRQDIKEKARNHSLFFVETALYAESGMKEVANNIWIVDAPVELRVQRVMKRNGMTRENVLSRINSQQNKFTQAVTCEVLLNDGKTPLLPRIEMLVGKLQ